MYLYFLSPRHNYLRGPCTDKGVPCPFLTSHNTLQKKGRCSPQFEKGSDRGIHVSEDFPVNGKKIALCTEGLKFVQGRIKHIDKTRNVSLVFYIHSLYHSTR